MKTAMMTGNNEGVKLLVRLELACRRCSYELALVFFFVFLIHHWDALYLLGDSFAGVFGVVSNLKYSTLFYFSHLADNCKLCIYALGINSPRLQSFSLHGQRLPDEHYF